jgi:hypothetical protein
MCWNKHLLKKEKNICNPYKMQTYKQFVNVTFRVNSLVPEADEKIKKNFNRIFISQWLFFKIQIQEIPLK